MREIVLDTETTGLDPMALTVRTVLNGQERQNYPMADLVFPVMKLVSMISHDMTLYPGDVLWMGTDGPTENMKDGDVVEVEIPGIGVLRNPVVRER